MEYNPLRRFPCMVCYKTFKRNDNLTRHMQTVHGAARFSCPLCNIRVSRADNLNKHIRDVHGLNTPPTQPPATHPSTSQLTFAVPLRTYVPDPAPDPARATVIPWAPSAAPPPVAGPPPVLTRVNNIDCTAQGPSTAAGPSCSSTPRPATLVDYSDSSSDEEMALIPPVTTVNDPAPPPGRRRHTCTDCHRTFQCKANLNRHQHFNCPRLRGEEEPPVQVGGGPPAVHVMSDSDSDNHSGGESEDEAPTLPNDLAPDGFVEVETGFRGRLKTYRLRDQPAGLLTIPEFLGLRMDYGLERICYGQADPLI